MDSIITRRINITGKVQGVGFRDFVHAYARGLGLNGYVRNRKDGTVEVRVSGETYKVEALIAECGKGPPASKVESIEMFETQESVDKGFKHLPTV